MITYINTSSFSIYLIVKAIRHRSSSPNWNFWETKQTQNYEVVSRSSIEGGHNYSLDNEAIQQIPLTQRQLLRLGLEFCLLWFGANWTSNASLAYTTVASSTILSSMSGFFTLAFGALAGVESFSAVKLAAVVVSVVGVVCIAKSTPPDSGDIPSAPFFGDMLALLGAVFYGAYSIVLKLRIGDESRVDMSLFFGYVGLFNVVLLWPAFPLLSLIGIEPFEIPHGKVWPMIIVNALIGTFLSDYLWLLALLLTSPLVVTLGLSLTIPFALIGDVLYKHVHLSALYYFGAVLVLCGFIAVNHQSMKAVDNEPTQAAVQEEVDVADAAEQRPANAWSIQRERESEPSSSLFSSYFISPSGSSYRRLEVLGERR